MLLVTGGTEKVGKAVLAQLAEKAVAVRVLASDPAGLEPLAANIQVMQGELSNEHDLKRALEGVEAAFLASTLCPKIADLHAGFVAAAKASGVSRIVQLSGVGADVSMSCARALRWLGQMETSTQGFPGITNLRPTFLMQTLLKFYSTVGQQGTISGPFRSGQWTFVDAHDVGAVAVAALLNPHFQGGTYTVTGAESLTYVEVAERLSAVLDKPVRYMDITANEARGRLQAAGAAPVMIEATLELWDACASKLINVAPTNTVRELLGREPRSFEEFVRDHRQEFFR